MKKTAFSFLVAATALSGTASFASDLELQPDGLQVSSHSFENGEAIPSRFAFCMPDGKGKTKDGGNISPQLSWTGAPEETKSFALVVVDPDVPKTFEAANQKGKVIPENFTRQDFYHWVLIDIPASVTSLDEGADSKKITPGGKPVGKTAYGINGGNDYSKFMKGSYGGYDGPCPPWNDERLHHYHFIVYALNVRSLGLSNPTGPDVEKAVKKHTIATGEIFGTYTNSVQVLQSPAQ